MKDKKKGHWKMNWNRKRTCTGGKFVKPRKKTLVYVEPKKKVKEDEE